MLVKGATGGKNIETERIASWLYVCLGTQILQTVLGDIYD